MNKQELRRYFKDFLIKNQKKLNSDSVRNSIISKINNLLNEIKVTTIGIYCPLKYEINLLEILNLNSKVKFFLPKIINEEMKYCPYDSNDQLGLNDFSTLEIINNNFYIPELLLIPGLAFSLDGYRLGYGQGHFDRYINNNKDFITIGVCLKEQLIDNLPITSHDQKLNFIVTD